MFTLLYPNLVITRCVLKGLHCIKPISVFELTKLETILYHSGPLADSHEIKGFL